MEAIKDFLPLIGSLFGGVLSAGPWGAIFLGVGLIVMLIGGGVLYSKFKKWQFQQNKDKSHDNAVDGHNKVIEDNQNIGKDDSLTVEQHKKDEQAAIDKLKGN